VHGLPPKAPAPLEPKLTVPVGVVWPRLSVSVTVAVHVDAVPTATVPGEQLTLVEVESVGGENSSTLASAKPSAPKPPATSTCPSGSKVAVC